MFSIKGGNLDRLFQFSISQVYVISAITTFPANCLFLPILAFKSWHELISHQNMSLDVPDRPGSETICQSYFELQFRSEDSQRSFTIRGRFVGTDMTGKKTRTNSAQGGQSCKYPAIYILQCCNLIFHVLHFHVIRMKNNFVKTCFHTTNPKCKHVCSLKLADTLSLWSTKLTWKRNN